MDDKVSKYCMFTLVLTLSIMVLLHVYYIRLGISYNHYLTFWLPILIMGFLALYATVTSDTKFPLILVFIFSLTLHLIQFIRQPANMVWNPDAIYAIQLVNKVIKTGHWDFGYGTGQAFGYSFYPLFYLFQSALSLVPSFSPMLVIKYSMAILNLLTLLTFYALVNGLFDLDVKSKNLIIYMFSLNPIFHAVDSYAHAESYASILYPLILLYVLKQRDSDRSIKRPIAVMAILLMITVSMSHHFTSYMVAFSLLLPMLLLYLISGRFFGKNRLHFLALILPLTWLTFIASFIFTSHFGSLLDVASKLTFINKLVGYVYSPAVPEAALIYYPSEFSMQITLLRNIVLALFTLIGLLYCISNKKRRYTYFVVLLLLYSVLTFLLLYCTDWAKTITKISDARDRIVEFSFFPIAFFSAIGIITASRKREKILKSHFTRKRFMKPIFILIFVIIFVPSTIFNAFPRFMYDPTYSPILHGEFCVAPEQQYALGRWVSLYVNSFERTVFSGSLSAHRYVIGYGLFQGSWSLEMFNVTLTEKPEYAGNTVFYVVNEYNFRLPDHFGRKLDASTVQFLDKNFNRVYDNRAILLYNSL